MTRKLLGICFSVLALSISARCQDFQKCVNNSQLHFINGKNHDIIFALTPPSPDDGILQDDDLRELHRLQNSRNATEIDQANKDANELDIFIFQSVLGDSFNVSNPNLRATTKLSQSICEEATAISTLLKGVFKRKRPFIIDTSLNPPTDISFLKTSPSYPSGHSVTGYLEALTLAEILPGKRDEILKRAAEFAHNRMVLGVHFGNDVAAGKFVAYGLFAEMKKNPRFTAEISAARSEIQSLIK